MTKKDYIKIASLLRVAKGQSWDVIILSLSQLFKMDNPNFDEERFLKACGKEV